MKLSNIDHHIEQLLPRYVLVKYATRGLVQEGRLSPLFSQLYALAATTFVSIHFIRCVLASSLVVDLFIYYS